MKTFWSSSFRVALKTSRVEASGSSSAVVVVFLTWGRGRFFGRLRFEKKGYRKKNEYRKKLLKKN